MTTTEAIGEPRPPEGHHEQASSWSDIAFRFAGTIAGYNENRRGDLAGLRRMDPDDPDAAVYWRLMASEDLFRGQEVETKWALILHGIALMTPTNSNGNNSVSAHDGQMPVGRALFLGSESQQDSGFYSEMRLNRLLTARGSMLRTLLARMFRMLASAGVRFNWREMANFILADEDGEAAERARRRIARDYYQAERRNAQSSNAQSDD